MRVRWSPSPRRLPKLNAGANLDPLELADYGRQLAVSRVAEGVLNATSRGLESGRASAPNHAICETAVGLELQASQDAQTIVSQLDIPPEESTEIDDQLSKGRQDALPGSGDVYQPLPTTSTEYSPQFNRTSETNTGFTGTDVRNEDQTAFGLDLSSLAQTAVFSPGAAPFDWYELLAQDAISNLEKYPFLSHESRWEFDPSTLLQRPSSHYRSLSSNTRDSNFGGASSIVDGSTDAEDSSNSVAYINEPWNTTERIVLEPDEASLYQYFLTVIGPLLDLFDPADHFSNHVPHLAMHNTGLMKSILAVAAIHRSLHNEDLDTALAPENPARPQDNKPSDRHSATQFYYDTLTYLSQAMQHQSYAQSSEILATSILISTYEMFDGSNRDWERHLKGSFWILRTQDNDGESLGLRNAVWWAWLRQDIWAAFRDKRRTLTIWQPTIPLQDLKGSELACRSLYLLAKAVEYSSDEVKQTQDLVKRLEEGNLLLCALDEWKAVLPDTYLPLPIANDARTGFELICIHPPSYAAAIETYCFARIVIILNMPSTGSINEYHDRQKILDSAIKVICGLAQCSKAHELPLAFVSIQCLFAAGQCIRNAAEQIALLKILEDCIAICKWPPKSLIGELKAVWDST
ncbi:hypothetical protein PVAG01_07031 [Phlyctema vagabunda]|uniref:Transcription factor domain-containing protein n=1 Tax=Phlyctema vagabunda TaxID=108571 RepID=A0ABR4PB85_9HELO